MIIYYSDSYSYKRQLKAKDSSTISTNSKNIVKPEPVFYLNKGTDQGSKKQLAAGKNQLKRKVSKLKQNGIFFFSWL